MFASGVVFSMKAWILSAHEVYLGLRFSQNRTKCLNCASNWTRAGTYGTDPGGADEYTQDARIAARLINIYNECVDWREIHAEDDFRKFLITATLAMISG